MATSTVAGRVHELGVKLEPSTEVEIKESEDVNSSVENDNDNGRRCLLKCLAAVTSAGADDAANASTTPGSPLAKLTVHGESCHEFKSKTDKIREAVEQVTSDESKKKITRLLAEVQQLPDVEKLLLYLRLPSGSKVEVDPLKQSFVSSLANRYEVTQTITWIQTHLEEDPEVSLPKQEVYDGYCEFCNRVSMKPLSTADFGKVMKQVFPNVRPRRLGTRGNSRYCYAGLRKKVVLDTPRLPDLSLTHEEQLLEEADSDDQELNGAISFLIREWAEKILQRKFTTLKELAYHLVENGFVSDKSVAAFTVLSYVPAGQSGKSGQQQYPILNHCDGSKHRETRMQLQRKLHERESIREQKKRLVDLKCQGDKAISSTSLSATHLNLPKLSTRKSQNAKSTQPDTLRKLLSNSATENGTTTSGNNELKNHLGDVCCSTCDNNGVLVNKPKLEKNGSFELGCNEKVFNESRNKMSPLQKRRGSSQSAAGELMPVRRRSGGGGGDRKSPKPSGWGTPITDIVKNRATPLSSEIASTTNITKSRKVLIPRVTSRNSNNGNNVNGSSGNNSNPSSKLCFPSTNIIIFPQISTGVPISAEFNGGAGGSGATATTTANAASNNTGGNSVGGQKSKYKLIQPKPCTLSSSNEVKSTSEEKDNERAVKPMRRGSNSNLKRNSDDKEDLESVKNVKNRKRNKHPSDMDKMKSKRMCVQQQHQARTSEEEAKCVVKSSEDEFNEGLQDEMNITTLEQDALLDCWNDSTGEQEDGLMRYMDSGDEKLSQLRQLLERNFKTQYAPEHQANDGLEPSRKDVTNVTWASSSNASFKDNTPTLRSLLRHGGFSDIHNLLMTGDQTEDVENLNVTPSNSSGGSSQVVDASQPVQVDLWRQGNNGDFILSTTRTSDEILMSSDSSSGCYPTISTGGSFMSLDEGLFDRGQENSVNQQQLLESNSGNQMNSGILYTGHVVSYPQMGNGNSSVPPSPNTRRRAFNFQPISPQSTPVQETHSCTQSPLPYGPMLSTVRNSYGAGPPSATSSPFVSPRSTPSSVCRSRHNSGQPMNTTSSALGTPRATPHPHHLGMDQSSCQASPFISPHPTPIPFARSRHNSSQQRFNNNNNSSLTCTPTNGRSRHPSELVLGPLLSPSGGNSAPMSPLESQQQQSHSSVTHYCDTITENHFYNNNNRSRHNSSSSFVSLPPRLPSLPLQNLLNVSSSNSLPLGPPPPPPIKTVSDVTTDNVNLIQSWSMSDTQVSDWPNKLNDPRLRHRHASVESHFLKPQAGCSTSLQGHGETTNIEAMSSEVSHLMKKIESTDIQGVVSRSRSVPIYQLMQNMIQQTESSDEPIRDVLMSHSYPATPTGQSTFNFGENDVSIGGGNGSELELGLNDYQSIEEEDIELRTVEERMKPYQQNEETGVEESVNEENLGVAALQLPMDQYQNIIPSCHLDDIFLNGFPPIGEI